MGPQLMTRVRGCRAAAAAGLYPHITQIRSFPGFSSYFLVKDVPRCTHIMVNMRKDARTPHEMPQQQ